MVKNYRAGYGLFAVNGILFNHGSPRRGETFVTRKITRAIAQMKYGLQEKLYLGNLEAGRDWGFAGDFVEAMWLMLQQEEPGDYVVATGISHSVRDLIKIAFNHLGLDYEDFVVSDPKLFRPAEVDHLLGDPRKAKAKLRWQPKVIFEDLVKMMVDSDIRELEELKRCQDVIRKLSNNRIVG